MKIRRIKIENFKAIKQLEINNIKDTVVIAGPNGSGKSCIFDTIRFIKSAYGGYNDNELNQWFGEFQLDLRHLQDELPRLLNDTKRPLIMEADFEISQQEQSYIVNNIDSISESIAWRLISRDGDGDSRSRNISTLKQRDQLPKMTEKKNEIIIKIHSELNENSVHRSRILLSIDGQEDFLESLVLSACFSTYDPNNIGIIEYHSANRNYARENVGGIQLNIRDRDESRKQYSLYDTNQKYNNIKSEMASAYVRELIAKEAGSKTNREHSLIDSLKELFNHFFNGKTFDGPVPTPDGKLAFEVKTKDGAQHDINELSSGEKEVLFGYLRLRNATPKNSILLLDEPELHLNPRLIRGLPRFYQRHIGTFLNNQIWLVTHSDAFLRETVGQPDFSVFHMKSPLEIDGNQNQLIEIKASEEIDAAVIDLVGDLATYAPGKKIVIFEGGGGSDFDLHMVSQLFPDFVSKVNAISGESKARVHQLQKILQKAKKAGVLPFDFFSVVDKDSDIGGSTDPNKKIWNVYHIENYLLVPDVISRVVADLRPNDFPSPERIDDCLKICAEKSLDVILSHELRILFNQKLVGCLNLQFELNENVAEAIFAAAGRSIGRITKLAENELSYEQIKNVSDKRKVDLREDMDKGRWRESFRGRDILKQLISELGLGLKYEMFRNLLVSRMRDTDIKPEGMRKILGEILDG